jgi:hypothetical protein
MALQGSVGGCTWPADFKCKAQATLRTQHCRELRCRLSGHPYLTHRRLNRGLDYDHCVSGLGAGRLFRGSGLEDIANFTKKAEVGFCGFFFWEIGGLQHIYASY